MPRKAVFHDAGVFDDGGSPLDIASVSGVSAHLADSSDAHDASAISIVDTGTYFTATDVEAALQEIGAGGIGGGGGGGSPWELETPAGTVNGSNDTFTLSAAPDPAGDLLLWKNGLLMKAGGVDYTLTGSSVVFVAGQIPPTGAVLLAALPGAAMGGGGGELDYVARTTNLTVTSTADGASGGTLFITGNSVTYDGSTRICIEVYVSVAEISTNQAVLINLYEGTTDLGRLGNVQPVTSAGNTSDMMFGRFFLTPTAGSHTYLVRAWKTGGTATLYASAGGSSAYMPAYMRITEA